MRSEIIGISSTRPYFRRKLFFFTFAIVLFGALCVAAGLYALFPVGLGTQYGAAIVTIQNIEQMLVPRAAGLYTVMTGFLVLAISFLHLFYSHRVAGPAFQLGRETERISRGDLNADFRLRRKDNLTDLADALRQTAGRYRETVTAMDRHVAYMEEKTEVLSDAERPVSDPAALASMLREMALAVKSAEKLLSEIRT